MVIEELCSYNREQYEDISSLMSQLSASCVSTEDKLSATLHDSSSHLYIVRDEERIVGCATLCVFHSPTGAKASIEDVVVASEYRGRKIGKRLIEHLITESNKFAPIVLQLTSNPKRIAANALYQSIGFKKKDTNSYRMTIPARESKA